MCAKLSNEVFLIKKNKKRNCLIIFVIYIFITEYYSTISFLFPKVLNFVYSNYFIAQFGISFTRINNKMRHTIWIVFMRLPTKWQVSEKKNLVVIVMVMQIAYNLVGNLLFIQTQYPANLAKIQKWLFVEIWRIPGFTHFMRSLCP